MKGAMNLAHMGLREMRIDLGGRDIAMPKHLLDCAQIGTALEQMGGKAVSQRVRADPSQTRLTRCPSLERLEKALPRHRPPKPASE